MSATIRLKLAVPAALVAAAAGLVLGAAVPARAATAIGQLDPAATPSASCADNTSWVQRSSASSPGYEVPAGSWVVTSWTHKANASAGKELSLRIWQQTADPNVFTMVGGSASHVLAASAVNTFSTRIPVSGGNLLGLRVPGGASCLFSTGNASDALRFGNTDPPPGTPTSLLGEFGSSRLNVTAQLEADSDRDGYGDETQDLCPTNAAVVSTCPVVAPPPAPAPPVDTTAPVIRASSRKRESIGDGSISIFVRINETAAVRAVGTVNVPKASRVHRVRLAMRPLRAAVRATLRVKLSRKTKRAIVRALRRGVRVRAVVTVLARDAAGHLSRVKVRIRLVR